MGEKNISNLNPNTKVIPLSRRDFVHKKINFSRFLVFIEILIALLIVSLLIYSHINAKKIVPSVDENGVICQSSILKNAGSEMSVSQVANLELTVNKIKSLPNYDKDSNCLYVVDSYYINIADTGNALIFFKKLENTYKSNFELSSYIDDNYNSIAPLKLKISNLVQANNQTNKNSQIFEGKQ